MFVVKHGREVLFYLAKNKFHPWHIHHMLFRHRFTRAFVKSKMHSKQKVLSLCRELGDTTLIRTRKTIFNNWQKCYTDLLITWGFCRTKTHDMDQRAQGKDFVVVLDCKDFAGAKRIFEIEFETSSLVVPDNEDEK